MTDLATLIDQSNALRTACYELGKDVDHEWLRQAYLNGDEGDIKSIEIRDGKVHVEAAVWTSQTGGSNEWVEFDLDADLVAGHVFAGANA